MLEFSSTDSSPVDHEHAEGDAPCFECGWHVIVAPPLYLRAVGVIDGSG